MKALLLLALLATSSGPADDGALRLNDAWLREAPPGVAVNGGYFSLCNDGSRAETLLAVRSERFARIEMHETIETGGKAAMRKTDTVGIAAGKCIAFEPNGRHLMLFDADPRITAGESIVLHFEFASGKEIVAIAEVHRGGPEQHDHH